MTADPLQPPPIDVPQDGPDGLFATVWQRFFVSLRKVADLWRQQPFVTFKASTNLTSAQNLGLLASGLLKTTLTGAVATLSSTLDPVVSSITVDSPTFFVDKVHHNVGVGTVTPSATVSLDIVSSVTDAIGVRSDVSASIGNTIAGQFIADGVGDSNIAGFFTVANGGTNKGLYVGGGGGAGSYAIYVASTDDNVLSGRLGVFGSPSALLSIGAGDGSAGHAPLEFTSGSLLTVPEAGAIEFVTDAYYGTITTGPARKTFAFLENPIFPSGITVDSPTFFVDSVNHRIGVGTITPADKLSLALGANLTFQGITLETLGASVGSAFRFKYGATDFGGFYSDLGSNSIYFDTKSSGGPFQFFLNGVLRLGLDIANSVTISTDQSSKTVVGNSPVLYLKDTSGSVNTRSEINIGYRGGTYRPVCIGFVVKDGSGNTSGDVYIATRNVTTDTAPTERLTVQADGNVGIGTTAPTAALHVKAGTATANTAPVKLTSGTLLTSPEAGAIEFLTDAYYGTQTTGPTRKQFAMIDAASVGAAGEVAAINTTGLTANVGASTLYAVPATGEGFYRVSAYVVETVAGSVSSVLPNVQILYTDKDSNVPVTIDATPVLGAAGLGQTGALNANTGGTVSTGVIAIYVKASTTIQYQTSNYASVAAGMTYALRIRLELL